MNEGFGRGLKEGEGREFLLGGGNQWYAWILMDKREERPKKRNCSKEKPKFDNVSSVGGGGENQKRKRQAHQNRKVTGFKLGRNDGGSRDKTVKSGGKSCGDWGKAVPRLRNPLPPRVPSSNPESSRLPLADKSLKRKIS